MSDEDWGPWIEHDGKGCPVKGHFGQCEHEFSDGRREISTPRVLGVNLGPHRDGSWNWDNAPKCTRIIKYRIRKPRGLTTLEKLLQQLPAPTKVREKVK